MQIAMCGRFTLTIEDIDALAAALNAEVSESDSILYRPRFNVAPSDVHWLVRLDDDQRALVRAMWGFVSPKRPLVINVRAETAAVRPPFRDAMKTRRCIVPADGFYEWTGPKNARRPFWFHRADDDLLLFAGVYEEDAPRMVSGHRSESVPRFTIFTMDANEIVAPIHGRMPVVLSRDEADEWLRDPGKSFLTSVSGVDLVSREVSSRVSSIANDDPDCLAPWADAQGRLF